MYAFNAFFFSLCLIRKISFKEFIQNAGRATGSFWRWLIHHLCKQMVVTRKPWLNRYDVGSLLWNFVTTWLVFFWVFFFLFLKFMWTVKLFIFSKAYCPHLKTDPKHLICRVKWWWEMDFRGGAVPSIYFVFNKQWFLNFSIFISREQKVCFG